MHPGDLEDVVDRALKQLPEPRAPRTLVPRVMAAIEARAAPGQRARGHGSRGRSPWQLASVAALIVLGVGVCARSGRRRSRPVQQSTPPVVADVTPFVADAASKASAVANVTRIVWHALVQPLVGYLLVLVLVMCAACATFGAALGRVALGGVSQT